MKTRQLMLTVLATMVVNLILAAPALAVAIENATLIQGTAALSTAGTTVTGVIMLVCLSGPLGQ